jgi:hypothetical protein
MPYGERRPGSRRRNGPGTPAVAPFDFGGANELPVVWTQPASIAELS